MVLQSPQKMHYAWFFNEGSVTPQIWYCHSLWHSETNWNSIFGLCPTTFCVCLNVCVRACKHPSRLTAIKMLSNWNRKLPVIATTQLFLERKSVTSVADIPLVRPQRHAHSHASRIKCLWKCPDVKHFQLTNLTHDFNLFLIIIQSVRHVNHPTANWFQCGRGTDVVGKTLGQQKTGGSLCLTLLEGQMRWW